MSDRLDKKARKEKLQQMRAQGRAAARAELPLPDEQMRVMFDMLDTTMPVRGCDHTLRLVREWADQLGLPFENIAAWCRKNGGFCDCEVLANAEQAWREAIHDVDW